MSHSARQGERESMQKSIDDKMDDLMIKTDQEKIDLIADLVYENRIQVDNLIEWCESEIINYYSEQWRLNK